jgi:hypothetical protein
MTMVNDPRDRDEALISVARNMVTNNTGRRSERVMYYRSPRTRVDGSPYVQASWIVWGDTSDQAQLQKLRRGFIPLEQFGLIESKQRSEDPDGAYELYGPWGAILSSAAGVREFPRDQILAYHWYDEQRLRASLHGNLPPTLEVRDGIVKWPQLQGDQIKIYVCPECANQRYNLAVHLARHLRVWHDYDRQDVLTFCQENGIDLNDHVSGHGRVVKDFIFESTPLDHQGTLATASAEDVGFSVEMSRPLRGPGRPRKDTSHGFLD